MNNKRVVSIYRFDILRLKMIPFQIKKNNNNTQRGWMVNKINRPALKF